MSMSTSGAAAKVHSGFGGIAGSTLALTSADCGENGRERRRPDAVLELSAARRGLRELLNSGLKHCVEPIQFFDQPVVAVFLGA